MQAYFETETTLPVSHCLNIQLPDEIPAGKIRIAVIYEKPLETVAAERGNLDNFLASLPLNRVGRTAMDIQQQIQQERDSWDET
jgi:hypothetical protein